MYSFFAAIVNFVFGRRDNIAINARVNRVAGLDGVERIDGRVLKIVGDRARVCWPTGQKTNEDLASLVLIAE
ncbi:hypothetical protein [Chitinolyticbacter meiyuanensis]|uniref:hypothetical protein n=1 Tax=Chitinolyticbacter meiyuanensis TaxID=682798 RepID=UPI0011E5C4F1|nr:hypothetical protein [Chitinolyticbacter meiyuanensis]